MNELPLLLNGPMVRAVLARRKTQARRPVGQQPPSNSLFNMGYDRACFWVPASFASESSRILDYDVEIKSPFGAPGDLLYVRETWAVIAQAPGEWCMVKYRADNSYSERLLVNKPVTRPFGRSNFAWRPSIHMPKWATRLWLRVLRVWVERVQDIGHLDALSEGIDPHAPYNDYGTGSIYRDTLAALWDSIYAAKALGWDDNPLVWACEFEVVR